MNWRLHLSDSPIHTLHLLSSDSSVMLAIWLKASELAFYAAENGALLDVRNVSYPVNLSPTSDGWPVFVDSLRAPNGIYLPVINTGLWKIYTSHDGRLRVYQGHDHLLILDADGWQSFLERDGEAEVVAVGLDRELGTIGALSADGLLHIYQQHIYLGAYPVSLTSGTTPPLLLLPDALGCVILIDAESIQVVDTAGQVLRHVMLSAPLSAAACSPDGSRMVILDRGTAILRIFDSQLNLIRQQSALDLMENATQLQLLAGLPGPDISSSSVDITNDGLVAFALDGAVCLIHTTEIATAPRTRALF